MRLGLAFTPFQPPEELLATAHAAESAGLDELWLWEDCFKEGGLTAAAVALARTERVVVGIGLVPVPLRNVALTAMEAATLTRLFPGRFILGVGHGVQEWMGQVGGRVASPLTLLEEYATALRQLLRGDRVGVDGRYVRLDDVALDWPPEVVPPVMVGGAGPKTLALAGRVGDGTLLGVPRNEDQVAAESAATLATAVPGHPVVSAEIVATGPDAQERLDREMQAWGCPTTEGFGAAGDPATVAARVRAHAEAGVTSFCAVPTRDDPDRAALARFLAQEVRPLLG